MSRGGVDGTRGARGGGGFGEFAVVALAALTLTTALSYPLAFHLGTIGRTDGADGQFSIWNVAWVARTLVVDPVHIFDANIFYPNTGTLFYSEANLGAGVLALPAYWLTRNPYVANNVVTLLSFVLSALGAYYLVRYLTRDRWASALSAVCFSCCPYVFAHVPHIQLLLTAGLPFSMLAFHRLADRPSIGRGLVVGLVMAAQAVCCGYYGIFVMLMVGFATLLVAGTRGLWTKASYWGAITAAAAVAILAVLPLLLPYLALQRTTGFARALGAGQQYSADWRSYLASSAYAHTWMLRLLGEWREVAFPGFVVSVLGLTGAVWAWRAHGRSRELAVLYGSLAVLACWASLGPGAGLYTVLYRMVPGFTLLRAASRFCIVVVFSLSILAGFALAALRRRTARPLLVGAAFLTLSVADVFVSLPFRPVPDVEPGYRVLATLPRGGLLEMPVYSRPFAFERAAYMLASTTHWMPLVNAYSDYIPAELNNNLETLGDFPSQNAFRLLARDQVRYVVFHLDRYSPEMTIRLRASLQEFAPYLRRLWADHRLELYEIESFPPIR